MVDAAFDTLSVARRMEQAGFTRQQSEALAEEQARLVDERLATKADIAGVRSGIEALRLETKADIEALRLSTSSDIEALRLSTKSDFELLRRDIVIKIGGMIIASVAVVSTLMTFLARFPFHP